jgi:ribose 5-phosphate isomerase B
MKSALAADHAGFALKESIRQHLAAKGFQLDDLGTNSAQPVDYPDYAVAVGEKVATKEADCGILVCGTGIGMSIAANKVHGIRAAHVTTESDAQLSREHNDANVLALGGRVLDDATALKIVDRWLKTNFAHGHHERRVEKIGRIESSEAPKPALRSV